MVGTSMVYNHLYLLMLTLRTKLTKIAPLFLLALLTSTSSTSAHEAYVLTTDTINRDITGTSPNPFSIIAADENQFLLWGFICILGVVLTLLFSLTKKVEVALDPILFTIKKYAPLIARLTFGSCLIASAYNKALFGPELPFSEFSGIYTHQISILFYVAGISILLGIFVRTFSFVMLIVFIFSMARYGIYMLTYANYVGEIVINLILGAGAFSLGEKIFFRKNYFDILFASWEKYAFFLLRILFGTAVIFASFYAKFLHSQLALDVITEYNLVHYFHFTPLFIVLGAFIVECIIGLFFIIGFEIRATALVFLTFLALSLSYFGEAIWPHIILLGVNIALFAHGYDEFTIEKHLFKQEGGLEPVL